MRIQRELRKGYISYFGGMNINPKSRFSLFRCMYQKEVNEFIETKSINSVWINESLEIFYSNQKKYIHYNLEKETNGNEEEDSDETFELNNISDIDSSDKYKKVIESLKYLDKSRVKNRFKQFFRIIEGNVTQEDIKMILLDIEPPNRNYLVYNIGNEQLLSQSNIDIIESQDEMKLISLNSKDKFILYLDYILKIPNHLNNLKEAIKRSYGL